MNIEELKEIVAGATKGPWNWEVNRSHKRVELCGGKNATDLTVMSFARYGMSSAAPVFWFWNGNVSAPPKRADLLAIPAPNREHHSDWFARVDHPDARLIALAPELAARVIAADELVKALLACTDELVGAQRVTDGVLLVNPSVLKNAYAALSAYEAL